MSTKNKVSMFNRFKDIDWVPLPKSPLVMLHYAYTVARDT